MAERCGQRRVFVPLSLPSGRPFARERLYFLPIRGRRVWEEFPGRLLLTRQRQHPCGASGLVGGPTPNEPRSYSNTLFTHSLHQGIRASVGSPTRTGGRPRGACGEEGTTVGADLLSVRTLAPPFCLVTGFSFQLSAGSHAGLWAHHRRASCTALRRHTSRRSIYEQQQ